jgi:hypothetical protein
VEVQSQRSGQTTFLYRVKVDYTCNVVLILTKKLHDFRKDL